MGEDHLLRTDRLTLRPLLSPDQLDGLVRVSAAAHNAADPPRTVAERQAHAERTRGRSAASFGAHGYGIWLLHRRDEPEPCGWCGLKDEDPTRPELTYGLAPDVRGAGLATEAVRAVLAVALARERTAWVWGAARPENAPSVRVMERAGLTYEGRRTLRGIEYAVYRFPPLVGFPPPVSSSASEPMP